jgi:hypothetical protein
MGAFSTPRPVPNKRIPTIAGAAVVALALPVVLLGGFSVTGWALAAVLWAAAEVLGIWLARVPTGADHLKMSGIVALTMAWRGIAVMVVLLIVTASNKPVGVTAVVIYALAYSLSLAVSLIEYFNGPASGTGEAH